ncbi:MAG: siroheme synthase CysG [Alphaproteobacteria bacterium]|nr:siroheme synthase CysG [Alphaproteobacteria bacterium]MCW5740338.1 siroheme synthase CysG [Alphaproteobacteria bacterium]
MRALPLFHDLRDRLCLVIGGGEAALRKAAVLESLGARVVHRATADDLDDVALVVVAGADEDAARRAFELCRARGVPVNAVDRPRYCTVTWPAIVDRDPITIAIGTAGAAPTLARLLRARIERAVPAQMAALARLAESWRARVKAALPLPASRLRFWERFFEGAVAEAALDGDVAEADRRARALLSGAEAQPRGVVHLVGAGPGDPELLTLRALRLIQSADVIVHDRLVGEEILAFARVDAQRIYVGKRRAHHCVPQPDINTLLIEHARAGRRVVRLKGGDPFVFGRGGEEIEALLEAGIACDVTPGITAATGCAAYAGIPLTHRDHAHTCLFVTGHLKDGILDLNWDVLARPRQTLAVYMGLVSLPQLSRQLIAHRLPGSTPAAVVIDGTRPTQRVIAGTLASLPGLAASLDVSRPALVLIGDAVGVAARMPADAWAMAAE